jgi:hypothetical protein
MRITVLTDNREQEDSFLVELAAQEAPLGNQKSTQQGHKNWNALTGNPSRMLKDGIKVVLGILKESLRIL